MVLIKELMSGKVDCRFSIHVCYTKSFNILLASFWSFVLSALFYIWPFLKALILHPVAFDAINGPKALSSGSSSDLRSLLPIGLIVGVTDAV